MANTRIGVEVEIDRDVFERYWHIFGMEHPSGISNVVAIEVARTQLEMLLGIKIVWTPGTALYQNEDIKKTTR